MTAGVSSSLTCRQRWLPCRSSPPAPQPWLRGAAYGRGSIYTCRSRCKLGLRELLGSGSSLGFLLLFSVPAAIFGSTVRFGWPSVFALCHRSRWVPLAGAANAQGPVCVRSRCNHQRRRRGRESLLYPCGRLRSPESFEINWGAGRIMLKAPRRNTRAPRPSGTPWPQPGEPLGLLENPPAGALRGEKPKPAPAMAGASLNSSIPGRRFSAGRPSFHETLGKFLSPRRSVGF